MLMRRHLRKLLILAAVAAVAPVSPVQAPATAEPMRHDAGCPYARAAAAAAQRESYCGGAVSEGIPAITFGRSVTLLTP
jgi:hypothetical protein